jgi:hypothetical protein
MKAHFLLSKKILDQTVLLLSPTWMRRQVRPLSNLLVGSQQKIELVRVEHPRFFPGLAGPQPSVSVPGAEPTNRRGFFGDASRGRVLSDDRKHCFKGLLF